jgi:flavin reductase (DIM6/NTAB) family NADH-FMN oxidoreductase RutF
VAIDPNVFRSAMGTFATGVTVVTTNNDGYLHGLTANGVSSLSLDPMLFIVCVAKKANAHVEMTRAESFAVSVLTEAQEAISNTFASSSAPEPNSLRGVAYHCGMTGDPLVDGALAYIECKKNGALDGGDHTIFVGEVVSVEIVSDDPPLLYYRGGYRKIA